MQRTDNVRPIIIKRKKVSGGGGHHGGAWKVAYADFVTAMMAFFLMLWLLGSSDDEKRKGIADYFSATYAIQSDSSGGDGLFGGESLSRENSISDDVATRERGMSEALALQRVAEMLERLMETDEVFGSLIEHIAIRMTDEGLIVEVFDLETASLFDGNTLEPNQILTILIDGIAGAFRSVTNPVAIRAHTRGFPTVFLNNPVWHLSIGRAKSVHDMMEVAGLEEERFQRITGNADRVLAVENPTAARNNRVEIVLLRQAATAEALGGN